jgi:hypothetical protein
VTEHMKNYVTNFIFSTPPSHVSRDRLFGLFRFNNNNNNNNNNDDDDNNNNYNNNYNNRRRCIIRKLRRVSAHHLETIYVFKLVPLVPRSKNAWSYTSTPPIRFHGVVLS